MTDLHIFRLDPEIGTLDQEDERQGIAREVIGSLVEQQEQEGWTAETTNLRYGLPASRVPVGWVQDQIQTYIDNTLPSRTALRQTLYDEVPRVIQRLKRLHLQWNATCLAISFSTKDDFGWYDYAISVTTNHLKAEFIEPECVRDNVLYLQHVFFQLVHASERHPVNMSVSGYLAHLRTVIDAMMATYVDPYE